GSCRARCSSAESSRKSIRSRALRLRSPRGCNCVAALPNSPASSARRACCNKLAVPCWSPAIVAAVSTGPGLLAQPLRAAQPASSNHNDARAIPLNPDSGNFSRMTSDCRTQAGTRYMVATPISTRSDLSVRAQQVLASVDVIACEDTRHTSKFRQHLGLHKPLLSVHEHNERARIEQVAQLLRKGQSMA